MSAVTIPQNSRTIDINSVRDTNEEIIDKVLLLYLINEVNKQGELSGITKLMKLLFFAEKEMVKNKVKGFNYNFYKWYLGPFTPEVYGDLDYLTANELVTEHETIELTDRGKAILKGATYLLDENRDILIHIDKVARNHANEWASTLMDIAYETKVEIIPTKTMAKVREIPNGGYLVTKISKTEADTVFEIDRGWLKTFDTFFDKEEYNSLMEAMESARTTELKRVEMDKI